MPIPVFVAGEADGAERLPPASSTRVSTGGNSLVGCRSSKAARRKEVSKVVGYIDVEAAEPRAVFKTGLHAEQNPSLPGVCVGGAFSSIK